jgi:hypothetical protein
MTKGLTILALALTLSIASASPSKAGFLSDMWDSFFAISVDFNGAGNSGGGSSVVSITGGDLCFNNGVSSSC